MDESSLASQFEYRFVSLCRVARPGSVIRQMDDNHSADTKTRRVDRGDKGRLSGVGERPIDNVPVVYFFEIHERDDLFENPPSVSFPDSKTADVLLKQLRGTMEDWGGRSNVLRHKSPRPDRNCASRRRPGARCEQRV